MQENQGTEWLELARPDSKNDGRESRLLCASAKFGPGHARYSRDNRALLIPELRVEADIVRSVSARKPLVDLLRNVEAFRTPPGGERYSIWTWSYVWGDLQVYAGGEPTMRQCVFLRGHVIQPNLDEVMPYVRELTKPP